jgi:hypothetical protein
MSKEDDLFESLAKKHPDLIQKSEQQYLGVGAGWYNIIDALCGLISYRVNQARYKLKYAMENQGGKYAKPIPEAETDLAAALDELPTIMQIKEKFGGLRFYINGGDAAVENHIQFAEAMAGRTCEICGSPGEPRNDGWVKTLCEKHHRERQIDYDRISTPRKKTEPKLSDE